MGLTCEIAPGEAGCDPVAWDRVVVGSLHGELGTVCALNAGLETLNCIQQVIENYGEFVQVSNDL